MGEQIVSSFWAVVGRIVGYLPSLLSGIVILAVGYALSRLVGRLVARLLGRTRFDQFAAERLRYRPTAAYRSASSTAGRVVFWLGMLVTLSLTANALGLRTLSAGLNGILGFVPNLLVAAIIVGVAAVLANLAANLLGDIGHGWASRLARTAIMVFAAFMALNQLGIAGGIVTTTFAVLVGALAVAAAIAFGVGNIRLAGELTRRWTSRWRERAEPTRAEPTRAERYEEPPEYRPH
jgi:Conserved TM helix